MQTQQVSRGEILAAFQAAVGVRLVVVGLELVVRGELDGLPVGRQRAPHVERGLGGGGGGIQLGDFGGGLLGRLAVSLVLGEGGVCAGNDTAAVGGGGDGRRGIGWIFLGLA